MTQYERMDIYYQWIIYFIIIVIFEISPSPLTVAVEQGTATFQCQCSVADFISWRVNGMSLNMATNLSNISTDSIQPSNGVIIYRLSIGTLLVYDGTTIDCAATFIDGLLPQVTPPVSLHIQGILYQSKI